MFNDIDKTKYRLELRCTYNQVTGLAEIEDYSKYYGKEA